MPAAPNTAPRKFVPATTGWVTATIVKTRTGANKIATPGILEPGDQHYPKNGLTQTREKFTAEDGSVTYKDRPFGIGRLGGRVILFYISTPASGQYPSMRTFEDVLDGAGGLLPTAEALLKKWYSAKPQKDTWADYLAAAIQRANDTYSGMFKDCGFSFNEETSQWTDPDGKPSQLAIKELLGREFGCAQHGSYVREIEENQWSPFQPYVDDATGKNIPQYESSTGAIKIYDNKKTGEREVVWTTFFANKGYSYGPVNIRKDKRADKILAKKVTGEELTAADEQVLAFYKYGLDDLDLVSCMTSKERVIKNAADGVEVPDRRNRPWVDGSSPRIKVAGSKASTGAGAAGDGGAGNADDDIPF